MSNFCWNENLFLNKNINSQFKCSLKHSILNDPVYDSCGHLFCRGCITEYMKENTNCPISKKKLNLEFQDALPIKLVIEQFQIHCKNYCGYTGSIQTINQHDCIEEFQKMKKLMELKITSLKEQILENKYKDQNIVKNQENETEIKLKYFDTIDKELKGILLDEKFKQPINFIEIDEQKNIPYKKEFSTLNFENGKMKLGFLLRGNYTSAVIFFDKENIYTKTKGSIDEIKHEFWENKFDGKNKVIFEFYEDLDHQIQLLVKNGEKTHVNNLQLNHKEEIKNMKIKIFIVITQQLFTIK